MGLGTQLGEQRFSPWECYEYKSKSVLGIPESWSIHSARHKITYPSIKMIEYMSKPHPFVIAGSTIIGDAQVQNAMQRIPYLEEQFHEESTQETVKTEVQWYHI